MNLVDYTHPARVPALYLPNDRRTASFYLRLDELPEGHPFYSIDWAIFRHPEWLEGGSAWVQAKAIFDDLKTVADTKGVSVETLRPVVGSADPAYDEALAQGLTFFGLRPMVAEVAPRNLTAAAA